VQAWLTAAQRVRVPLRVRVQPGASPRVRLRGPLRARTPVPVLPWASPRA